MKLTVIIHIYIKLPKELEHLKKALINIQNIDDKSCWVFGSVRHLNPADYHPEVVRLTLPAHIFFCQS